MKMILVTMTLLISGLVQAKDFDPTNPLSAFEAFQCGGQPSISCLFGDGSEPRDQSEDEQLKSIGACGMALVVDAFTFPPSDEKDKAIYFTMKEANKAALRACRMVALIAGKTDFASAHFFNSYNFCKSEENTQKMLSDFNGRLDAVKSFGATPEEIQEMEALELVLAQQQSLFEEGERQACEKLASGELTLPKESGSSEEGQKVTDTGRGKEESTQDEAKESSEAKTSGQES